MKNDNSIHCNLVTSNRRTLSIIIEDDGKVVIRAPRGISKNHINKFLEEKKKWIKKKVNQSKEKHEKGKLFSQKIDAKLIPSYKRKARAQLENRAEYFACKYDLKYKKIRLSSAKRRWGSCSPTNNLNFNWKIIFAPELIIDYLVVHELAHTKQKNHQKKFWKLVEEMHPQFKQSRKWLRENSFLLTI